MKKYKIIIHLFALIILFSCKNTGTDSNKGKPNSHLKTNNKMEVTKLAYGNLINGIQVNSFTLKNDKGMEVEIIELGAIVKSIKVPDKNGETADVVLGYDDLSGYINDPYYFGATIGRVANRIGGASFLINDKKCELAANTLPDFGKNHLHGGVKGFNKVLWEGNSYSDDSEVGVILKYLSEDGEEGYPGNLNCTVRYSLNEKNELRIDYKATTDQITLVNFTHHSYFNLKGEGRETVLNQEIMINADKYTPASDDLIPIGEIAKVEGSPVDFTTLRSISSQIDQMQMAKFKGYDLNYVLNHSKPDAPDLAAIALDPSSGRMLEVYTTQPCMHFYTSNFLEGKPGKGNKPYNKYGAFCFEPQGFPDAPNKPQFESVELNPGERYIQTIIYKFSNI